MGHKDNVFHTIGKKKIKCNNRPCSKYWIEFSMTHFIDIFYDVHIQKFILSHIIISVQNV
jgi:hypothetical protein